MARPDTCNLQVDEHWMDLHMRAFINDVNSHRHCLWITSRSCECGVDQWRWHSAVWVLTCRPHWEISGYHLLHCRAGLSVDLLLRRLKAGTHYPCSRAVFTARVHGWYFWRPCDIIEAREHGPCCLKTVLWRQYDVMTLKVWRYIFCKHGNH